MVLNYLNDPNTLIISFIVMIFALIFHNIAQSWVASRYGDNSPRFSGFMNFDPQQQLEPIGVVLLALLGFGWPKTVPINSRQYKGKQEAVVWYAGPLSYLIVGFASVLVGSVFLAFGEQALYRSFLIAGSFAVLHAIINLFPVYPLDGARAAMAWGNRDVRNFIQQIASYGLIGFIVIFFLLSFTGIIGRLQFFFLQVFRNIISLIPGL
ncbi:MAG: site-2 protease family protein [Trueperaceae bacterium]|nr:site-2 protease family protein [Trueperaceae bacterium]